MPLVSIVTPAYNAALFVADAISSVQAQTIRDWEMLIVDDCSQDATRQIVTRYAALDERIVLLSQPENRGPANARDAAIRAARGRYIAFLDSDDWWLPLKLERQIAFMREREAAVSFTEFRRVSADKSKTGALVRIPPRLNYTELLKHTAMATSSVIVDRNITGPFRMTKTFYDDFALWLELLKRGVVAYGLQEDLMRYRVITNSWSRNKLRSARWVWRTYREVEKLSVPYSAWCFAHYAWRAIMKYRVF